MLQGEKINRDQIPIQRKDIEKYKMKEIKSTKTLKYSLFIFNS